ncbi:hypothetical protein WMY93_006759 [Mugilogobius chulae]|uniref:C2H2-type domain-containing protein n=1 Tax=Mugilogobius chulae TaxID=88201 RepID=A0AAW0PUY0_9GOBI
MCATAGVSSGWTIQDWSTYCFWTRVEPKEEPEPEPELSIKQESEEIQIVVKTEDDEDKSCVLHPKEETKAEADPPEADLCPDRRPHRTYSCSDCGQSFRRKMYLIQHKETHSDERPHKCSECDKMFKSFRQLKQHMKTHSGGKGYICAQCDEKFSCRLYLDLHQRLHRRDKRDLSTHTEQRPSSCSDADRKSRETLHRCSACHLSFSCRGVLMDHRLKQHMATHSGGKGYICAQCDETFSCRLYLDLHQRLHRREKSDLNTQTQSGSDQRPSSCSGADRKPLELHRCSACHMSFSCRGALLDHTLKQHMSVHTQQQQQTPASCPVCGTQYTRRSTLQFHMLVPTKKNAANVEFVTKTVGESGTYSPACLCLVKKPYS